MDRSQETLPALDELRLIRQEARQTRSLDTLRWEFDRLQNIRRLHIDDFDLQVVVADIHQEIVERARYLRGETPSTPLTAEETYQLFPDERSSSLQPASTDEAEDQPEAAEIPPEVPRLDPKSWQIAVGLAVFLTVLVLAAFFYLIQTARKINFKDENTTAAAPQAAPAKPKAENVSAPFGAPVPAAASMTPTLRLYTDLVPGTVTIDDEPPRDVDGELVLDHLKPGQHAVKVTGTGGMAAFRFEVTGNAAPRALGTPVVVNAMAVLVSVQDGQGRLVTNAQHASVTIDGKAVGDVDSNGLTLTDLGKAEHDLRVTEDKDNQRFVLTYTPAPVLTAYVKSDPSVGTLVVATGQDDVDVYIEDKLYRRKTAHGQVRIPLRAGKYKIRVHKAGFIDPPASSVEIKKAEETEIQLRLHAAPEFATLQIKGGAPGMTVSIDQEAEVTLGPDGSGQILNVKAGDRTVELRHNEFASRKFVRTFHAGEATLLSGPDLTLEKLAPENTENKTPPAIVADSKLSPSDANAVSPPEPDSSPAGTGRVRKGGGFIPYGTPKAAGHYSFQAQARLGGFLKRGKLQWYAGYRDGQNYVMFILDGKRATVREMVNGKSIERRRIPFNVPSNQSVEVDLSVTADSVSARVRTPEGAWSEIGTVTDAGRDFTQDRVGLYIPDNDEVAVSNFQFSGH